MPEPLSEEEAAVRVNHLRDAICAEAYRAVSPEASPVENEAIIVASIRLAVNDLAQRYGMPMLPVALKIALQNVSNA